MTTPDEEFLQKLRATFNVEADEHLAAMSSMLMQLEKVPLPALIERVYREAHSLKGAARAVELSSVEAICQAMEGVFAAWKKHPGPVSPDGFDLLHHAMDAIRACLAPVPPAQQAAAAHERNELIQRLTHFRFASSTNPFPTIESKTSAPTPHDFSRSEGSHSRTEPGKISARAETVRISTAKLDARLLQAEEMLATKSTIAQRALELREVGETIEQWWKEWAKVSPHARLLRERWAAESDDEVRWPIAIADFLEWNSDYVRSLERKINSLVGRSEQDRRSISKQVDELLEDSKKLLMLPFSTLSASFPKLVRDLCRVQNKVADFVIDGSEIEIDKRILEGMKDAMVHILRNCIDHGIETPAERQKLNKPPRATLRIVVSQVDGNKVEIAVMDDGAGVDVQRVKASAVEHGIISSAEANEMSPADAMALIFRSDVSTSPVVSEISGRGLGMAIVRAQAEKLGGQVFIESQPRVSTTLRITLPLTMATFRGLLVKAANQVFVLPLFNVESVLQVRLDEIRVVRKRQTISVQGQSIALASMEAVLGLSRPAGFIDESAPLAVVILKGAGQRMAFAVDDVLHEEEVLAKSFRAPLVRVRNIAGASILGNGQAAPIINVLDLLKSTRLNYPAMSLARQAAGSVSRPAGKILLVEDSITSRMLLKSILESAGYDVTTAVDGLEAFAILREKNFDLLVSDVEMPRLNGFGLTGRIRADKRLADLPIVLVTGLESPREREMGIEAGANAYVVKSSFGQSNLLDIVGQLL
jgi:two-component system chemotaxis sensor kinase CheA